MQIVSKETLCIFMQIVSKETICIKCKSPFSGNNNKNVFNLSSAEFAQTIVKVTVIWKILLVQAAWICRMGGISTMHLLQNVGFSWVILHIPFDDKWAF